jgi:hypothetical protein
MCLLWGKNWVLISQKTAFFILTLVKTSRYYRACLPHRSKSAKIRTFLWPGKKTNCWLMKTNNKSFVPVWSFHQFLIFINSLHSLSLAIAFSDITRNLQLWSVCVQYTRAGTAQSVSDWIHKVSQFESHYHQGVSLPHGVQIGSWGTPRLVSNSCG